MGRVVSRLGKEPVTTVFAGMFEEAEAFVASQNLHRRHLTAEFRRQRANELRARGMSTREIAKELGVGIGTVHRDLNAGVPSGTPAETPAPPPAPTDTPVSPPPPPPPPRVTGRDGKQYPAARPRPGFTTPSSEV